MRTSYRVMGVMLLILGLLAPGCLKRNPPVQRSFVLEADRQDREHPPADGAVLYLHSLSASPLYEGREFVYRKKDDTLESDFHNGFFILPAQIVTGEVRQWLAGSDFIREIATFPGAGGATRTLTGRIEALFGDYRGDSPKAVLEIDFLVLNLGKENEIQFHRKYREEIAFSEATPDALVQGWNEALERILAGLEKDLRALDLS